MQSSVASSAMGPSAFPSGTVQSKSLSRGAYRVDRSGPGVLRSQTVQQSGTSSAGADLPRPSEGGPVSATAQPQSAGTTLRPVGSSQVNGRTVVEVTGPVRVGNAVAFSPSVKDERVRPVDPLGSYYLAAARSATAVAARKEEGQAKRAWTEKVEPGPPEQPEKPTAVKAATKSEYRRSNTGDVDAAREEAEAAEEGEDLLRLDDVDGEDSAAFDGADASLADSLRGSRIWGPEWIHPNVSYPIRCRTSRVSRTTASRLVVRPHDVATASCHHPSGCRTFCATSRRFSRSRIYARAG